MATGAQVAEWVKQAGWSGADVATAIAVAKAESGWRENVTGPRNSNGSFDYGLFQINSIHNPTPAEKTEGLANARKAYSVWQGSGWKAWAAYNSGSYRKFLDEAQTLAGTSGGSTVPVTPALDFPNPLSGIGDTVTRLFSAYIMTVAGLALMGIGIFILMRNTDAAKAAKSAASMALTKGVIK